MGKTIYSEPYKSCSMMGALRIAANFEKTVCVINGPAGCAFFCRNTVLQINGYLHPLASSVKTNIYNIDFDEKDVIFGARDKLVKAVIQIEEELKPEMIFIFNCCVSEVIGEDLDEVVYELSNKINALIIPVKTAGFKGDHKLGMRMMNEILFDRLLNNLKRETVKRSVNILGETDVFYSTTKELRKILKEGNINILCQIPGRVDHEHIQNSINAELNIVICGSASAVLAAKYEQNYGIPFIHGSGLYSIERTFETYCKIYNFFKVPTESIKVKRNAALAELGKYKKQLVGKTVFIIAGARRAIGYAQIFKELGMKVEYIFSESSPGYTEKEDFFKYTDDVTCDDWDINIREKIRKEQPSLVISTIPEITMPIRTVSRLIDDFSGFEGTIDMAKYVGNLLDNKRGTVYWQTLEK